MTRLILTRGLPGCGKTTRALAWVREDPEYRARVGRDPIRIDVFGMPPEQGVLTSRQEARVTRVQQVLVRNLLADGLEVVVDDTNLPDELVEGWRHVARLMRVDVEVWDMRDVPIAVCIERDADRRARGERAVGEDIIRQLANGVIVNDWLGEVGMAELKLIKLVDNDDHGKTIFHTVNDIPPPGYTMEGTPWGLVTIARFEHSPATTYVGDLYVTRGAPIQEAMDL